MRKGSLRGWCEETPGLGLDMAGILIGLIAGLLGGFLGTGGGVIIVPLMTETLRFRQHEAHGTSLIAVVFTSVAGSVIYYLHGSVDLAAAAVLAGMALVTVRFGAKYCCFLPEVTLKKYFGFFLLVVALVFILKPFLPYVMEGCAARLGPVDRPGPPGRPDRLHFRDDGGGRREFHGPDDGHFCRHHPAYRPGRLPPGDDTRLDGWGVDPLAGGEYPERAACPASSRASSQGSLSAGALPTSSRRGSCVSSIRPSFSTRPSGICGQKTGRRWSARYKKGRDRC